MREQPSTLHFGRLITIHKGDTPVTRKPNFAKLVLGVFVLALLFIGTFAFTTAPRSTAQDKSQQAEAPLAPTPIPPPPSPPPAVTNVFEISDGNSRDFEVPFADDWNTINPANGLNFDGQAGNDQIGTFINDTNPLTDRIFTGGSSKDFQDIQGNWLNKIGSVPDKDEIDHAFAALYIDNSPTCGSTSTCGHRVLVFGGDRHATNGDANIGFWFFQNSIGVDTTAGTFSGVHKNGDLFIVSAFTQGGGTSIVDVYNWVGTPDPLNPTQTNLDRCNALSGVLDNSGDDTICKVTSAGKAFGIVNPFDLAGAFGLGWPYTFKGAATCATGPCPAQKGAFYEGGLDLDLFQNLAGECFSSFLLETRSSQSVDAVLKDFVLGSFQQCGITCSKVAAPTTVCEGNETTYTYQANNPNSPVAITVSLIDDNETASTADDIDVIASDGGPDVTVASEGGVPMTVTIQPASSSPTYTRTKALTLTGAVQCVSDPTKFNCHLNTLTVHVTNQTGVTDCTSVAEVQVLPNPTVSVNSPEVCDGNSATITATPSPAGTYTYKWTVPNGVTDPGDVDHFSASVAGTYSVEITNGSGCKGTGFGTLSVVGNPTVSITGDETCSSDNSLLLTAAVTGGSGTITYSWTVPGGVTNPGNSATANATLPGNYAVHVTRGNAACPGDAHLHVGLCAGTSTPGPLPTPTP